MHLVEKNKIETDDISTIVDTRDKKGPIVVTFNDLKRKIKVLTKNRNRLPLETALAKKHYI